MKNCLTEHDFGLTHAQAGAVKLVFQKAQRKRVALMRQEMRQMAREGSERRVLKFKDGNGGEVRLMIHPVSYHYWGQRLGYQCWEDNQFKAEYCRDNPEARVKNVAENLTVIVAGQGGLAASGAKRFHKTYGERASAGRRLEHAGRVRSLQMAA